jgi:hypothetical protein
MGDGPVKGEVTLIVAGRAPGTKAYSDAELLELGGRLRREGEERGGVLSRRDLSEAVAVRTGVPRRRVYRLLLFS